MGGDGDAITGGVTETSRVNKPQMNQSILSDETRGRWGVEVDVCMNECPHMPSAPIDKYR